MVCCVFVWWLFVVVYFVTLKGAMCACSIWLDTTFLLRYLHIMLCVCLLNQVARYNM